MVDMGGSGALAEVGVDVFANLTRFEQGMAKIKQQVDAVNRDAKVTIEAKEQVSAAGAKAGKALENVRRETQLTAAQTEHLQDEYAKLARTYDPLVSKSMRYAEALTKINILEKSGTINAVQSQRLRAGAANEFEKSSRSIDGLGKSALGARGLVGGLAAFLGVQAVSSLVGVTTRAIEAGAAIGKIAGQVGVSTAALQELRYAATQTGASAEDIDSALNHLSDTANKAASGAEREAKLFKLLGISLKDAGGNAKGTEQIFRETVDAVNNIPNAMQRAQAETMLFGQAGQKLDQMLSGGNEKIDQLRQAAHDLGITLSDRQIQDADRTAKKLEQVKMVLEADISASVANNANAIISLAGALAQVAEWAIKAAGAYTSYQSAVLKKQASLGSSIAENVVYPISDPITNALFGGNAADRRRQRRVQPTMNQIMAGDPLRDAPKQGGGIDLSSLLAPKGPRARTGGGSAVQDVYNQRLDREVMEELKLRQQLSSDLSYRHDLELRIIDAQTVAQKDQVDQDEKRKALTAVEARRLKVAIDYNADLQKEVADRKFHEEQINEDFRIQSDRIRVNSDILQSELGLARTNSRRAALEMSILDFKQAEERAALERDLALAKEAGDEKRIAELNAAIIKVKEKQANERQGAAVAALTGIEKFKNDLPQTVEEINEAIADIQFDEFNRRLQDAAQFAQDVGDAFGQAAGDLARFNNPLDVLKNLLGNLASQFTRSVIEQPVSDFFKSNVGVPAAKQVYGGALGGQLNTEQMNVALGLAAQNINVLAQAASSAAVAMSNGTTAGILPLTGAAEGSTAALKGQVPAIGQFGGALAQVLSGLGGGGGGLGGIFGTVLGLGASALGGLGGGIGGGLGQGSALSDSLTGAGLPGFAGGGLLRGPGHGTSDSFMIRASTGEHMTNAQATRKFLPLLQGINSGRIPDMNALLNPMMGANSGPSYSFGNINVSGVSDAREARTVGRQIASTLRSEMALASKRGYGE